SRLLKYLVSPCGLFHSRPRKLNSIRTLSPTRSSSSCAQRSPVSWNSTTCGYFGLSDISRTNSRFENRSETCLVSKIVWSLPVASIPIRRRYGGGLTRPLRRGGASPRKASSAEGMHVTPGLRSGPGFVANQAVVPTLHDIAEAARHDLMLCS